MTQNLIPHIGIIGGQLRLFPAMNLLGVRHLILRQRLDIPVEPVLSADGFHVYENPRAGQRTFIPRRVLPADDAQILKVFEDPRLEPDKIAFVDRDLNLPSECRGTADINEDSCNSIKILARMETPGLSVLADLWDAGWQATVNGQTSVVLRVDTAVRGVLLAAGESTVVFHYWPPRLTFALRVAAVGLGLLTGGSLLLWWTTGRPSSVAALEDSAPTHRLADLNPHE